MIIYLLRRLWSGIILVFVVTAVTFFLTFGAGIPVAINILGPNATQEQIDALNAQLGLDQPIVSQYLSWLGSALTGDLGKSYFSNEPVTDALATRLPVTMSVVLLAAAITLVVSVILGVIAAARPGATDGILQSIAVIAYVFPAIVLGVALVYIFAIRLAWLPAIGFTSFSESPSEWLRSVILPAVVLSIGGIAALASQIRGSLSDELSRDYVRTLTSRGSTRTSILLKHALRNASGPAFTTFSLQFIAMFGGALFIEKIFALPGYGTYGFLAVTRADLPAMLGVTLFSVVLVVIVNLIVDVANGWLNPKARVS